jgi:hypothetical protein
MWINLVHAQNKELTNIAKKKLLVHLDIKPMAFKFEEISSFIFFVATQGFTYSGLQYWNKSLFSVTIAQVYFMGKIGMRLTVTLQE